MGITPGTGIRGDGAPHQCLEVNKKAKRMRGGGGAGLFLTFFVAVDNVRQVFVRQLSGTTFIKDLECIRFFQHLSQRWNVEPAAAYAWGETRSGRRQCIDDIYKS